MCQSEYVQDVTFQSYLQAARGGHPPDGGPRGHGGPVEGIDTRAGMAAAVKPAPATKWEVHKFGGAGAAAGALRTVGDLLIQEAMGKQSDGAVPTMAIVSAMGGMTDLLVKVVDSALVDIDQAKVDLGAPPRACPATGSTREILVVKSDSAGLGEKGSTSTTGVVPLWGETSKRMAAWWTKWGQPFEKLDYNEKSPILVCTGFVATSKDGVPTTLKRCSTVGHAPCIGDNIPVYVRNIFNPSFEGTVIEGRSDTLAASWGKVEDDEDAALIKGITSIDDASLLTLEGASLAGGASEVGEKVLAAMSNAKVSVLMITQASSESSVTIAVPANQGQLAIRAVEAPSSSSSRGRPAQLLKQLKAQQDTLETELKTEYKVIAVANSAKMTLATADQTAGLLGELGAGVEPMLGDDDVDLDAFSAFVEADVNPQRVIIDATASEDIAARYEGWIEAGISVVCAKLNRGATWQYESSVGAALPVLTTLQDLLATGDKVTEIRGCLSGTMAYTLRNHQEDKAFSASLAEAYAAGFTEPDVREDLSGVDMARKVVILARELGLDVDVEDVDVESIIPAEMVDKTYVADPAGKAAAVFADLKAMGVDAAMDERLAAAKAEGAWPLHTTSAASVLSAMSLDDEPPLDEL
ncbi:homoserine dehydrogenase [Aureococcus anophagefferens]|nr:homoserine dehydrogenase [Aureococcus anophagefferens]